MIKRDKLEGSFSVDGDITPITRQHINQVDANDWQSLTIAELSSQRLTLQERLYAAQRFSPSLVKSIQLGIKQLDHIIDSKSNNDIGLI